jgi:hypothetical protein
MRGRGLRFPALVIAMAAAAVAASLTAAPSAVAAPAGRPAVRLIAPGHPWHAQAQPARHTTLPVLGQGAQAARAGTSLASAAARARATGKPVPVTGLTTQTTTVTAEPDGREVARDYVLPVRVRQHRRWTAVSTRLRRTTGGRLTPAAVPGDAVTFTPGGEGPAAVISTEGTRLALSWPGRLPRPVVSGSSATYRDVLPGVDLVLTATSAAAGGFSEVLVVRSRAAARDPRLASLTLPVTESGTTGLRTVSGGGLAAAMTHGRGSYLAPAPRMWDSSAEAASPRAARQAAASARHVGAGLAAPGSGPASTTAGPAGGARLAPVLATVLRQGTALSLAPDHAMLTSPSTRFPVFIDPSFTTITGTSGRQAYDPVQSECPSSHYDSSSYTASPVGYDNFNEGTGCDVDDTDYALYRVGIPSGVFGADAVILSASFQTAEVYTSDCSSSPSVTTTWIDGIGTGTGWPGPAAVSDNVNATGTVGPDPGSCNTVEDTAKTVAAGFNVKPDLNAISSASAITFRLWEPGNTDEDDHKQFSNNPDLQVIYTDTPNTPASLEEAATSSGTGSLDCDTSPADPPRIGKTDSADGLYLLGTYSDGDGGSVQANIRYWNYTGSSAKTTVAAAINGLTAKSGEAGWQLPASYTAGLANGTVMAWQAQAETGSGSVGGTTYGPYSSAWSDTCYFAVYPDDPDAPAVTPDFSQAASQPVGSQLSFTITQSGGDTASDFVWALDTTPPTTGSIPAAQTCTTAGKTAGCTQITGGSATLTITVTAPGPHDLWVYEQDAGGNDSGMTNAAAPGSTSTFSGAADPPVSYTSGSSLSANFAAALGAGQPFDDALISSQAGSTGTSAGDGGGRSLDEAQLAAAGWNPGQAVTADGATFTLPGFGPSGGGPDNVLAANQTIGAGPAGAQGSALVFLATSTDASVQVGGLASGSPDSGVLAGDPTAPAVPGGTPVTGSGCNGAATFNATTACNPATGTVSYASGCPAGGQSSYTLTVPDWVAGPSDIAALTLPDVDDPAGQEPGPARIYAFAVPVDAACTVTSVTLPDVSGSVDATAVPGSGGVAAAQSALHIFGVALRNTTTATPEVTGTPAASPAGQAWTGAFESPVEGAYDPPAGHAFGDQTVRIALSTNLSAPAGADVRIKLSDPGFLSADGTGPLRIGAATIARSYYGAVPGQTPVPLTFGGAASVTIGEGADAYSDPLTLPFAVTAGKDLLVSLWIENASLPVLPLNSFASGALAWFSASSTPNETADTTGTPFTGTTGYAIGAVPLLTGLDLTTPEVTQDGATVSPGEPTVVVAGDNVIDGFSSDAASDALNAPSQRLAGQLAAQGLAAGYGVVDAGIQSNQVLADGGGPGGISLLARADADILAEPDVGTVVLDEGLEDVLLQAGSTTAVTDLEYAYTLLVTQLDAFGINVITGDLTPCSGYANSTAGDGCSAATDAGRTSVDSFIDNGGGAPNCPADFDLAVSNNASPEALAPGYGTADDVNLTLGAAGGYAQLAPAVSAGQTCPLAPSSTPLPPVS